MCSRIVVAAILLVALTFVTAGAERPPRKSDKGCGEKCKRGEEFTECGTCDPTCRNRNPICSQECKVGCFCVKGLVRNSRGRCVPPSRCTKGCHKRHPIH